ncbi:MAG: pyridoxal 5'-phosphate synthase glutaminase subunit PdxT [Bryobacteraceae bacterium]
MPTIGVLALQGDFEAHARAFEQAGAKAVEVRTAEELARVDGLTIPGGESTTMLKLIHYENLWGALVDYARRRPVLGTCAGAILMAKEVTHPSQESFGVMDIDVERNAYGRQLDSSVAEVESVWGPMEAVFIRAPIIRRVGEGVRVLASYRGDPVIVEQGRLMVATFHPELTGDRRVQRAFLEKVEACRE